MTGANGHIQWASSLISSLADAGIRDVVISPGSRSTPLLLAVIRNKNLRLHTIIDERSAAFFAVGQAKVAERPTLIICTSGTAGAHYYPAIVEANQSFTPLVVLTADRPPELQGNAAPQTTDQTRMYGNHVRLFVELGMPDGSDEALRGVRRKAAQAVLTSQTPLPGPVHLNAPFRKPLEPRSAEPETKPSNKWQITRAYPATPRPDPQGIKEVALACRSVRNGLIVCGPAPLRQIHARFAIEKLAASARYPLLCEGSSQIRLTGNPQPIRCDGFDTFLRFPPFLKSHKPELIIQIGAPPISKGWERYVSTHRGASRFVIASHGWNDPQSSASALLFGDVMEIADEVATAIGESQISRSAPWEGDFVSADRVVWSTVAQELLRGGDTLTEGKLTRTLTESLPPGSLFAVGNSLPIREIDTFASGDLADVLVWSQRGVNGIDGLISGAAGAATAFDGPVTLFLGDLSFLHDLHGLAVAAKNAQPFVIVIAQNNGGRIFEQLPLARSPAIDDQIFEYWTTPHNLSFAHAATLFGHRYFRPETEPELKDALSEAYETGGCTVIEAVVDPNDVVKEQERLQAAVNAALAKGH